MVTRQKSEGKLMYVAATGWLISFLVHGMAWAGVDVAATVPAVWLLHGGCLAVWYFAVRKRNRPSAGPPPQADPQGRGPLGGIFASIPARVTTLAVASMVYAVLHFMLYLPAAPSTAQENGRYYVHDKGRFVRALSASEYHRYQALDLRGMSGLWLGFYGMALALLVPGKLPAQQSTGEEEDALG